MIKKGGGGEYNGTFLVFDVRGKKDYWVLGVKTLVVFCLLLNEVNHVETRKSND
jgi:hypothetical protein